jgi:hypothetical protein
MAQRIPDVQIVGSEANRTRWLGTDFILFATAHRPWPLQEVQYEIEENTMAKVAGIELPSQPTLANFARELKALVCAPERLM